MLLFTSVMCTFVARLLFDFLRFAWRSFSVQALLVQAINALASFVPEQIISNYDERTNCAILDDSAGFLWMYNFAVRISSIKGLCI